LRSVPLTVAFRSFTYGISGCLYQG
jgi:hypothetical protein